MQQHALERSHRYMWAHRSDQRVQLSIDKIEASGHGIRATLTWA